MNARPKVAVVVPLANEEETVDELLSRVLAQLLPQDVVFCVVDAVSKDRTRERVEAAHQTDARIVCVWAPENRCVVDAYFAGYRAALGSGAQWILEMDGGLSHQPEQMSRFFEAMAQGYDYAGGCRFMPGGGHRGNWRRSMVSWGGTLLANAALGTRMRDMTSGYECFTRKALESVVARGVESRAHFFQTEIRFHMHQCRWVEIPITYLSPAKDIGSSSLKDALRCLWKLRAQKRG